MVDYYVGDIVPFIQVLLKKNNEEFTLGDLKKLWGVETLVDFALKLHLQNGDAEHILSIDSSKSGDDDALMFFTVEEKDHPIFSESVNWKCSLIITGTNYRKGVGTLTLEIQEFHP